MYKAEVVSHYEALWLSVFDCDLDVKALRAKREKMSGR